MIPEPQMPFAVVIFRSEIPWVLTDHLEIDFQRLRIDPDPFDRARGGPHPEFDMGPFQGRTGRTGGGDQDVSVSHHQFSVCSDVDDQDHFILVIRFFGDEDTHVVRSDKSRFNRQDVNIGRGMDLESEISCLDIERSVNGRGKGRDADIIRG